MNPLTDANQEKVATVLRMSNVGTDQGSDSSRIHKGDFAEIDNQRLRGVGPDLGLKFEQCAEDEGTAERQDALSILRTGNIFDDQGLL
jgi:hypothetical protein